MNATFEGKAPTLATLVCERKTHSLDQEREGEKEKERTEYRDSRVSQCHFDWYSRLCQSPSTRFTDIICSDGMLDTRFWSPKLNRLILCEIFEFGCIIDLKNDESVV